MCLIRSYLTSTILLVYCEEDFNLIRPFQAFLNCLGEYAIGKSVHLWYQLNWGMVSALRISLIVDLRVNEWKSEGNYI